MESELLDGKLIPTIRTDLFEPLFERIERVKTDLSLGSRKSIFYRKIVGEYRRVFDYTLQWKAGNAAPTPQQMSRCAGEDTSPNHQS